ncbi:MAG: hypothetical protein ACXWTY_09550 [Methylobacter sp.]
MNKSKTIETLRTLATATDGRSESARLGDIISEVEAALTAGVKRKIVLKTLHQHYGFKMSMSGFEKALRRIRNAGNGKAVVTPTTVVPTLPATIANTSNIPKVITNPGELKNMIKKNREDLDRESLDEFDYTEKINI